MSKRTPRHHELPRYYLRGFDAPERPGHVWVFERGRIFCPGMRWERDNPCSLGIKRAGLHPNGYGRFEGDLQKQEHQADDALAKARSGSPLGSDAKQQITRYIGMTWRRLRVREHQVRPLLRRQFGTELRQQALRAAESGQFAMAKSLFAIHESSKSAAAEADLIRQTLLIRHERLEALLLARDWSLVLAPHNCHFVTTDNPVVFDQVVGVSRSPVLFPISRQVLLLITPTTTQLAVDVGEIPEDRVRAFNLVLIRSAVQHVFSSRPDRWIHDTLN